MKRSANHWSVIILILSSLLISLPKTQATPINSIDQTIEIQKRNRKQLRQEKRKVKQAQRQKRRISRGLGVLLLILLVNLAFSLFLLAILLAATVDVIAEDADLIIVSLICAILMGLCIWGIVAVVKALRSSEPKVKRSL